MTDHADTLTFADLAPSDRHITDYDRALLPTYARLLDADRAGAAPEEIARLVLRLDPAADPDRARRSVASHLARARWMTEQGYRQLASERRR
jgi:hypothetical protein